MDRLAYIVGNNKYINLDPLEGCMADADYIGKLLNSCGFHTKKFIDLIRDDFAQTVYQFKVDCLNYGVGLFYFAGHGFEYNGNNYLCPVDSCTSNNESIVETNINITNLIWEVALARDFVSIVILDCCRVLINNRSRSSESDIVINEITPTFKNCGGAFVAYATSSGGKSIETHNQGVYTRAIGEYINQEGLPIEGLFKMVRKKIISTRGTEQIPWEYSSLVDDFFFVAPQKSFDELVSTAIKEAWSYNILKENVHLYLCRLTTNEDSFKDVMYNILTNLDRHSNGGVKYE